MSIYQNIDKTLTETIEEHQRKMREAYLSSENSALTPDEMNNLVIANARALGARRAQEALREVMSFYGLGEESSKQAQMDALPGAIRAIEGSIDGFLRQKDTHLETLRLLADVSNVLKLEQYA